LARYEAVLLDLAAVAGDELLVGPAPPHRNRMNYLKEDLVASQGTPALSPSRLRTTWLVHHLAVGTRLPELAAAAGVHWLNHPKELLEFVSPLPLRQAHMMLRGKGRARTKMMIPVQ